MISVNVSEIKTFESDIKKLKAQISSMKEVVRKRIKRIKAHDFESSPAYKQAVDNDLLKISVKGKSYQQLQSEYWKLKNFLDMKTSTIKGINSYLDNIQSAVGTNITDKQTLNSYLSNFFDMASQLQDQLEASGKTAQAMDYRAIFTTINEMVRNEMGDLNETVKDVKDFQKKFNNSYDKLIERAFEALSDF